MVYTYHSCYLKPVLRLGNNILSVPGSPVSTQRNKQHKDNLDVGEDIEGELVYDYCGLH